MVHYEACRWATRTSYTVITFTNEFTEGVPCLHCSAREGKAVDLKCKGPRFYSPGAPEGFYHTGQGKLFGLS
eukprot:1278574-Prymnesium_polylepis.1